MISSENKLNYNNKMIKYKSKMRKYNSKYKPHNYYMNKNCNKFQKFKINKILSNYHKIIIN